MEEGRIMKRSTFGALVASAVMGMVGGTPALAAHHEGEAKACYRPECGKSVKGHEGKCGGTKVDALTTEEACTEAGGKWVTAAEAEKLK
jgi:hypothetical protein